LRVNGTAFLPHQWNFSGPALTQKPFPIEDRVADLPAET